MLDHVFTDAIGALRESLETALLERQAFEERFQSDTLLGDLSWETSYSLPGEAHPPNIRADISLLWPTWSQTSYRSWYLDGDMVESPHIEIEVVLRIQNLRDQVEPHSVVDILPKKSATIGKATLDRGGPTVERVYDADLTDAFHAIEISFDGRYEIDEAGLQDGSNLDEHFSTMGSWISSTLVKLGDLALDFIDTDQPR